MSGEEDGPIGMEPDTFELADEPFIVHEVQVVQSIDVGSLQATLKWLVQQAQKQSHPASQPAHPSDLPTRTTGEKLRLLESENEALKAALQQLVQKQAALEDKLDAKLDRDQFQPTDLQDIEHRLAALEAQQPTAAAADSNSQLITDADTAASKLVDPNAASVSDGDASQAAGAATAVKLGTPRSLNSTEAAPDIAALQQKLAHLEGVAQELAAEDARLRELLDKKADRGQALAPITTAAADAAPVIALSADGTLDNGALAAALNDAAAGLAALQAQVAEALGQLNSKASSADLDNLRQKLAALPATAGAPASDILNAAAGSADPASAEPTALSRNSSLVPMPAATAGSQTPAIDAGQLGQRLLDLEHELGDRVLQLEQAVAALEHGSVTPISTTGHHADDQDQDHLEARADAAAADAAAAADLHSALDSVADVSDLAAVLRDLIARLGDKADRSELDSLRAIVSNIPAARGSSNKTSVSTIGMLAGHSPSNLVAEIAALGAQLVDLQHAITGKAEADDVQTLVRHTAEDLKARTDEALLMLRGKADQAALDELRIKLALMGGTSGAADAPGSGNTSGGAADSGENPLLVCITGMLAGKANQADLDALSNRTSSANVRLERQLQDLRDQISRLASHEELDEVAAAVAAARAVADGAAAAGGWGPVAVGGGRGGLADGNAWATQAALDALSARLGDIFAELQEAKSGLGNSLSIGQARVPEAAVPASGGHKQDSGADAAVQGYGVMDTLASLTRELQGLRDNVDMLAYASNILAVGLDSRQAQTESVDGSTANSLNGGRNGSALQANRETRTPKGAFERLVKRLGRGDYNHKMDAFEQDILASMAQKLAVLDAAVKNPNLMRGGVGAVSVPDAGLRDLERQLKRLMADMRNMKSQMGGGGDYLLRNGEGDHAMLSAKPLTGYRCMACDRPLDKLDEDRGPHLPTQLMPTVLANPETARAVRTQRPPQPDKEASVVSNGSSPMKKTSYDAAARGPQTWYEGKTGAAAELLPREDVGPKLPGGGWRGRDSSSGMVPSRTPVGNGGLPDIGNRSPPGHSPLRNNGGGGRTLTPPTATKQAFEVANGSPGGLPLIS